MDGVDVTTEGGEGEEGEDVTTEGGEGEEGVDVTPQPLVSEKSLTATSSTALVTGETPHEVTSETLVATPGPAASTTAEVVTMTPSGSGLVTPGLCVASASCQGRCGGGSHDDCWCDDHCDHFGDCCCDLAALCSVEVTSIISYHHHSQFIITTMCLQVTGPGETCSEAGSCEARCGSGSDGDCWCDEDCHGRGDCCCDLAAQCGPALSTTEAAPTASTR